MAGMAFKVLLAADAEHDIEDVYRYIAEHDGIVKADRVLAALEDACKALEHLPERGNVPKEIRDLGMTEYRELHYKPYRIIYRILDRRVIVYCVVDGRRDMQSLLLRRLMR
jgi:toxin ParE1/3/4